MWRWNSYGESQLCYLFSSGLPSPLPSMMYEYYVLKSMSLSIYFTWLDLWDALSP